MTTTDTQTPPETRQTSAELAAFLAELERQEVSAHTRKSYRSDLDHFARWFTETLAESFVAKAVTPTDIRDYKAHLVTVQRRAPATVNRRLAALRKFFLWAKGQKLVTELPTELVKGVAAAPRAPKALAKRELDHLLRQAEKAKAGPTKQRNLAILLTLRHTGLRVSELCALTPQDLQLSERKGSVTVRQGKGLKYRVIPLNADVRRALRAYLDVRPQVDDAHLFIGQRGEGLQPQAVEDLVRKYARQAGLDGVTPHTFRHSFAKQLLDSGVNLVTVSALLGHERLETTAIYTQPTARDMEQAVEKLSWDGGD